MKTCVVLAVSIVWVSILFCPLAMAAPPMPDDVQIVQPDPSLPKELSAFFGKWEGSDSFGEYFLIVEKIDEQKASLYFWRSTSLPLPGIIAGWQRFEGNVSKDRGKCILWRQGPAGLTEYMLRGKYLNLSTPIGGVRLRRVP